MPAQSPLRRAAMPLAAWAAVALAPLTAVAAPAVAAATAGVGAGTKAVEDAQEDCNAEQTVMMLQTGHTIGSDQPALATQRSHWPAGPWARWPGPRIWPWRRGPAVAPAVDPNQSQHDLSLTGGGISVPEGFYGAEDAFAFFDANGDGVITAEELLAIFAAEAASGEVKGENSAEHCTELCAQRMLEPLDADGSGDVSFEEFEKVATEDLQKSGTSEENVETQHILDILLASSSGGNLSLISAEQKLQHLQQLHRSALLSLDSAVAEMELQSLRIQKRSQAFGEVSKLYTFGSPSVAKTPLQNGKAGNGKFDGLRIFVADRIPFLFRGFMEKSDPVVFACGIAGFKHPTMDALVLRNFDIGNPKHRVHCDDPQGSCKNLMGFPKLDQPSWWFHLHLPPFYEKAMAGQGIWPTATFMSALAMKIYDGKSAVQEAARAYGARLVEWHGFGRTDLVALVQEESSLDCTLAFSGSNDLEDWLNDFAMKEDAYCGFQKVHKGFVKEMTMILEEPYWLANYKPKFSSCKIVRATGHSLGGALATLFAACANNVAVAEDDPHFQKLSWVPGAAELLEEVEA